MAKTRYIKDSFWTDGYIENLDPIEKLLYIYLLTNPYVELCGVYELPLKRMSYETGIDRDMVERVLKRFQERGKIFYHDGWIRMVNFTKHQSMTSPKIKSAIERGMQSIPTVLIPYLYPIDTDGYPIATYTYTYRDNLDINDNLDLAEQLKPNGEDVENFDLSSKQDFDENISTPPTPLLRKSIINKTNKTEAVAVYDIIKSHAGLVDGSLDDCVVLVSKLKKLGDDPSKILDDIVVAMIHTGQDQFYSIASPRRLHDNLGTIYNKIKAQLGSQKQSVDLSSLK